MGVGFFVLMSQRNPCLPIPYEQVAFRYARTQIIKWVIQYAWCLESLFKHSAKPIIFTLHALLSCNKLTLTLRLYNAGF
ncbi:MAG: hypothetical protein AXW14_06835 [Alteromonas sp. Nap_26]|nr:MAG: hypothetical protein AXW14_06835 [Alteromonas sp. Nap_26]